MTREDLGKLLLRLTIGGLMLFHGVAKLRHGIGGIPVAVTKHGLPSAFAYAVYLGELLAPIAVILGIFTRPAAAIIAVSMAFAVWLAHTGDLLHIGKTGGYALELQVLYFFGAIVIAIVGPGRYAVRER